MSFHLFGSLFDEAKELLPFTALGSLRQQVRRPRSQGARGSHAYVDRRGFSACYAGRHRLGASEGRKNMKTIFCCFSLVPLSFFSYFSSNSIQFNSIQFNSIQFNSIQFNLIQFSSVQFSSVQFSSVQFNSIQFNSIQFNSIFS